MHIHTNTHVITALQYFAKELLNCHNLGCRLTQTRDFIYSKKSKAISKVVQKGFIHSLLYPVLQVRGFGQRR